MPYQGHYKGDLCSWFGWPPNQTKPNNAYLPLHDIPFWNRHTKDITKVTSAADLCDLRPAMKSKSLFKYVIPTILGYIRTIGDSQNLIAPFTIIREMCPDHSVKYRNLIFWLFSRVDLRHLEWFFEKIAESRPPLFRGGLLSSIFSKNHSKCLKLNLAFLDLDFQWPKYLFQSFFRFLFSLWFTN